ncbi:hypothetical protein [Rheinheimera sp.]|uniref:hypothetical protein n=1 Tax=Rheinheimera sp. TaxID=1869214 RepID=UPI003D27F22D
MAVKKVVKEQTSEDVTKPKKCFVIMPIADMHGYEPNHFTRVYKHLIKPALVSRGFEVERADDHLESDYIVIGIVQKIIESDLVLCDLSGRNPNVMYELGIRHAFDKPVVLIKDKLTERVFDIQGLRCFDYDGSLRIDSVEHDIEKIANSLEETFSATGTSINSIVALAQVHAPSIPTKTEVSAETQVILNAVSNIANRLNNLEYSRQKRSHLAFSTAQNEVLFSDTTKSKLGDDVFRKSDFSSVGTLVAIYHAGLRGIPTIVVKDEHGKESTFSAGDNDSFDLTGLQF